MTQNILCIGQSDSSAGTGIQGDLKTAQAFGVYAGTVVTSIKAQNTHGIKDSHTIPAAMIKAQMEAVLEDLDPAVIKLGMLGTTEIIDCIGDFLDEKKADLKVVIDPVMTNRAGDNLLDKEARDALKRRLLIHADVFTPNVSEITALGGVPIHDLDELRHAGEMLHTLGAAHVIVKGVELPGEKFYDLFISEDKEVDKQCERITTGNTHGAGTTMATGIACGIATGQSIYEAYEAAHKFMTDSIAAGPKIGGGKSGPLNHTLHNEGAYRLG